METQIRNPHYQAILIPGGGLTPQGTLPPWSLNRFEHALSFEDGQCLYLPLSAGTVHKPPPLDPAGFPIWESVAGAHFLLEHGIPADRILPETSSCDTIGNAYFSRMIHAEPRGLSRLLVITSRFHLERTRAAFEWVYQLSPCPLPYQLDFQAVPNRGLEEDALQARQKKEARSLQALRDTAANIKTLGEFHAWLYTKHKAYAPGKKPPRETGQAQKTY